MSESVKRAYSSSLREAQARETRRAIVHAGGRLFVDRGFGLTTIDDIATAAGVSRKTVFTSVGGKVEILKLAIDWAIVGDDEPVPLADRAPIRRAEGQSDPDETIRTWVDLNTAICGRIAALNNVLVSAAGIDTDAAELLGTMRGQRLAGLRAFAGALSRQGGLRDGLSIEDAADITIAHGDTTIYHTLVIERGWSPDKYRDWLYRTIRFQLRGLTDE